MGFLDGFRDWRKAQYDKKIENMRGQGKCPDCQGSGMNYPYGALEPIYLTNFDCGSCNGSGLFTDWATTTGREDLL